MQNGKRVLESSCGAVTTLLISEFPHTAVPTRVASHVIWRGHRSPLPLVGSSCDCVASNATSGLTMRTSSIPGTALLFLLHTMTTFPYFSNHCAATATDNKLQPKQHQKLHQHQRNPLGRFTGIVLHCMVEFCMCLQM